MQMIDGQLDEWMNGTILYLIMAQLISVAVSAKTSQPDRRLKAPWGQALKRPGWQRWPPDGGVNGHRPGTGPQRVATSADVTFGQGPEFESCDARHSRQFQAVPGTGRTTMVQW